MKDLVVCVDDFGYKVEVNEAVATLCDRGLISAVGCMSTAPAWQQGAHLLHSARRARMDVGLHINFTEAWAPGEACPLPQLIARAYTGLLDRQWVRQRIDAQLNAFEEAIGAPPDFVDGHQHVHQLPVIRHELLELLNRRYAGHLPWLRCTLPAPGLPTGLKPRIIAALGAHALRRTARTQGYTMNRALCGVYGFDADAPAYTGWLEQWLSSARSGDLLMVHPARAGQDPAAGASPPSTPTLVGDGIAAARNVEYTVFQERAEELYARYHCRARRLRDIEPWAD